jgi:hypothetical protein
VKNTPDFLILQNTTCASYAEGLITISELLLVIFLLIKLGTNTRFSLFSIKRVSSSSAFSFAPTETLKGFAYVGER